MMQLKPLGATGVMIPEIGFGTWRFRGQPEVIRRAVELGAFLIDTAEIYATEEAVGRAIAGIRDKCFLATKVSGANLRYKDVLSSADKSLRRLGIDRIDLYQVHWPNPRIAIGETMRAMRDLVESGKVRFVGVSNFSVRDLREAQAALGSIQIVSNQVEYSLFHREIEHELIDYCQEHQVTVMAYSPLAQGDLDAKIKERSDLAAVLTEISAKTRKTKAQVLLNWCVRHPWVVTIPKTDRLARVDENCAASGWKLTNAQYDALCDAAGE